MTQGCGLHDLDHGLCDLGHGLRDLGHGVHDLCHEKRETDPPIRNGTVGNRVCWMAFRRAGSRLCELHGIRKALIGGRRMESNDFWCR